MSVKRAAIILAAGNSTRMKSSQSKVLHEIGGRPLLNWVADLAKSADVDKIVCVVGAANADVRAAAEALGLEIVVQDPQLGTGHAVLCAKAAFANFTGDVAVLYADTPLIQTATLVSVFETLSGATDVSVLGFEPDDAAAYGRLVTQDGELLAIVEAKEATDEQLAIGFCNSGVMAASSADLFDALEDVTNENAKGEYYLTDIVEILRGRGKRAQAIKADADEVLGINSRSDLAEAEQAFQSRMRRSVLASGVTLRDPETVIFAYDTEIAADAEVGAHVVFGRGVKIAAQVTVHPFCHIEGAHIGEGAQIGPFARLRPGTELRENTKVGNFVEIKKSVIGKGSKVNHLSYLGDTLMGEGANIGAGTITCNYDGFNKNETRIGDGAFVGSNSSLIAPVSIGNGAYLGSGSVISKDVPDNALALTRSSQIHKEGWGERFRNAQLARKQKKS